MGSLVEPIDRVFVIENWRFLAINIDIIEIEVEVAVVTIFVQQLLLGLSVKSDERLDLAVEKRGQMQSSPIFRPLLSPSLRS